MGVGAASWIEGGTGGGSGGGIGGGVETTGGGAGAHAPRRFHASEPVFHFILTPKQPGESLRNGLQPLIFWHRYSLHASRAGASWSTAPLKNRPKFAAHSPSELCVRRPPTEVDAAS